MLGNEGREWLGMMGFCIINNAIRDRASCETRPCDRFVICRETSKTTHGCRSTHENTVRRQFACASIEKTGAKHRRNLHTNSGVYDKLSTRQVIIGIGVG